MTTSDGSVTELLERWRHGDRAAEDALVATVYPVLREVAHAQVRRNHGALTLQATELANEAYSRIIKLHATDWENRDHFFAVAAKVVRGLVIDYLRLRGAEKRGGRLPLVPLDELREDQVPTIDESVDWIGLDEALTALAGVDADCARVVELKFFSGLTLEKIAEVCGVSRPTVVRQWRFARAWLGRRLSVETPPAE